MTSHPNRSRQRRHPFATPSAKEIRQARDRAQMTQAQAARTIGSNERTWRNWEANGAESRRMPAYAFVLFLILTGQAKPEDFKLD